MTILSKLLAVVTSVDIGVPVAMDATPLLGGKGRNATFEAPVAPLTSTVKLQGAYKDSTGGMPAEGDAAWYDIHEFTATSDLMGEFELPDYVRWNTTVLDADGPDLDIFIRGVQ